jgi:hypothetical protein
MAWIVLLAFWMPGTALGLALRLRAWTLAAVAPALTFGMIASGTVVLGGLGVRWHIASVVVWLLLLIALAVLAGRRFSAGRGYLGRDPVGDDVAEAGGTAPPTPREHAVVALGVAAGVIVGLITFLRGVGRLDAVHQDWDAPFHGNAVRWIAEHGNPLPSDLAPIANQAASADYFYPNTYHALLALLLDHGGLDMPRLLNTAAMMIVFAWPVGVAAVGLAWRMTPVAATVAALVSTWFGTFPYDSLWRGPLWPYVMGVALVPGVLAVAREIVRPRRSAPLAGPVGVAVAATGVVALHTSLAFVLAVYAGMLLLALLLRIEPVDWRAATRPLLVTVGCGVVLVVPVVLPAFSSATGVLAAQWPKLSSPAEAFAQAVLFSPPDPFLQWYLGLPALLGLVLLVQHRRMIWLVGAYAFFAALFVAGAAHILPPLYMFTGIFYTDVWRIAALLPLAGALAIGELGGWLAAGAAQRASSWSGVRRWESVAPAGAVVGLVVLLAVTTSGAYIDRNASRLSWGYGDGPTVSTLEQEAYSWLAAHVEPGERVANDVGDGAVWMYALSGVQPVNWTFYGTSPGTPEQYLLDNLDDLDTDPRVRETLAAVGVRYVLYGEGTVRSDTERADGMTGLDRVAGLHEVFRNPDAVIYEVVPPTRPA